MIETQKKILFIIPKNKVGGAENVMLSLANEFSKSNLKIYFVILTETKKIKLNKKITLIYLNSHRVIESILKIKDLINRIKPEICFSTISHTNIALHFASKLSSHKCKIFLRESNNIFESLSYKNFIFRYFYFSLLKICYKNSYLISPSIKLSHYLKNKFRIKKKVYSIANPIRLNKKNNITKKKFDFINVGSLTSQKDHITLLKAFQIAYEKNKKLKLLIIGEGIMKKKILFFIKKNRLKKNVLLMNYQKDVSKYLVMAKTFLLSSRYEGYPNVLIDAAINSMPIISSNCNFGPSEILFNGKYGKLFPVGDYRYLSKLMLKDSKTIKKIPNHKLEKNKINKIVKKYYELFF
jgi:glycosyltransferase involved in cell wall biosynthesis|tara:strand:+ start:507 stop:1562 length:1056 start_codon:yes stop_codon:yes gene_type:complete